MIDTHTHTQRKTFPGFFSAAAKDPSLRVKRGGVDIRQHTTAADGLPDWRLGAGGTWGLAWEVKDFGFGLTRVQKSVTTAPQASLGGIGEVDGEMRRLKDAGLLVVVDGNAPAGGGGWREATPPRRSVDCGPPRGTGANGLPG